MNFDLDLSTQALSRTPGTLRALLDPPARRPTKFPLGQAGFILDTRLPGNRNIGHDYGTNLTGQEKADLVAFLESL